MYTSRMAWIWFCFFQFGNSGLNLIRLFKISDFHIKGLDLPEDQQRTIQRIRGIAGDLLGDGPSAGLIQL